MAEPKIRKVKTAVVGCGMISNIYIRNLKHLFWICDLAAVCDINPAAAREKAELYGVYPGIYRSFLKSLTCSPSDRAVTWRKRMRQER